jgi:type II secretion system protein N
MRTKIMKAVGYPLFFLVCLVFFLVRGFPVQLIVDDMSRTAQQKLGMKMSMVSVATLFPNGAEATGVRLVQEAKEDSPKITVLLDRLSARISLFGLLAGRKDVSFSCEALGGQVEGRFNLTGEHWDLKAKLDAVNLGKLAFWPEVIGYELDGKVTGTVDLHVVPKQIKSTRGELVLELVQGRFGNGKAYGVNVPWFGLGKTQINLSIKKGKAEIKTFKVTSDDIEASLDGYFLLQQKLNNLSAHCRLRFKPSDEKMREIRSQIPEELQSMFDNGFNNAKGKDGWYRYSVFGRILAGKPQFRPLKQ